MKYISTFILLLVSVGCTKVQFTDLASVDPVKSEIQDPPAVREPRCDDPGQPTDPLWVPIGMIHETCPQACEDGSTIQCQAFAEKEMVCANGAMVDTGKTRLTSGLEPIQQCPIMPRDCGTHPHQSKWWGETGQRSKVCEVCPAGENHLCQMAVESESQCLDGVVSPTGQVREGRFISYENQCLPLPPKSCGNQASGSSWWEIQGRESADCQTCWDGEVLKCEYNHEVEKSCNDGVTGNSGQTRRGTLIGKIGQCKEQPKNCGSTQNGQMAWEDRGKTKTYNCEKCLDGSDRRCVQAVEEQLRCDNGAMNPTGQTRDGKSLGYANSCPTNIVEKFESVTTGKTSGLADVLVIIDTTPSMFVSLNNLGNRFNQLINNWERVNWQLAITNSKSEKHFLDSWVLDGRFMDLQKNDMMKPVETIIKKSEPFAEPWFYRTVSRDPSDSGCDSQPYCMLNPSEPLRSLTGAIRRRSEASNKGFFRKDSKLVTIIVTDKDERNVGSKDSKAMSAQSAVDYFKQNLGSTMNGMTSLSIIIKPGDTSCMAKHSSNLQDGAGGVYGQTLSQFASLTNGLTASICEKDYGAALSQLGEKIRQDLESITLKDVPYKDSLKVTFTPAMNIKWVLEGKVIKFDKPLPSGTKIDIRYLVKTN